MTIKNKMNQLVIPKQECVVAGSLVGLREYPCECLQVDLKVEKRRSQFSHLTLKEFWSLKDEQNPFFEAAQRSGLEVFFSIGDCFGETGFGLRGELRGIDDFPEAIAYLARATNFTQADYIRIGKWKFSSKDCGIGIAEYTFRRKAPYEDSENEGVVYEGYGSFWSPQRFLKIDHPVYRAFQRWFMDIKVSEVREDNALNSSSPRSLSLQQNPLQA